MTIFKKSYLIIIILVFQLFSCSQGDNKEKKILASINDFDLTQEEFITKLAVELEMDEELKLTKEAREDFLESIIKKELLIQEARKRALDKNKDFMRTIERYWEATLIRNLMEVKGKEITKTILVSQEETEKRYNELKQNDPDFPTFQMMEKELSQQIREEKKTEKLAAWMDGLRKNAKIKIDHDLLFE